jgi:hypothetical protein
MQPKSFTWLSLTSRTLFVASKSLLNIDWRGGMAVAPLALQTGGAEAAPFYTKERER